MKKIVLIVVLTGVMFMSAISGVNRISAKPVPGIVNLKFQKCALVIGNQDYLDTKLNSPVDDANKMATALKELGFEVILLTNLSKIQTEEALQRFSDSLPTTGVCLFYFSGLGSQHNGTNYLMPVDVAQQNSKDVDLSNRCVAVDKVIQTMGDSHLLTKVLIFDTEFNDPGHEKKSQNLWINIPRETIISFATTPGRHALDGIGNGSPYTRNLLESLSKQGQTIEEVFKEAAKKVANESEGEQVPFMLSTLTGSFYPNHPADAGSEADAGKPVESSTDATGVAIQPVNWEPEMVFIKGGTFTMGCSNETNDDKSQQKPMREVKVDDFYMGKYEVTISQFKHFVDESGYLTEADKRGYTYVFRKKGLSHKYETARKDGVNWMCDVEGNIRPETDFNHPVIHISWRDAVAYCDWLSKKTGKNFILPTEMQWEYAAGNGSKHTKYSWGEEKPNGKNGGNVADETAKLTFKKWSKYQIIEGYFDGYVYTSPVGSYNPNEFGLFDMSGNVGEMCEDGYKGYLDLSDKFFVLKGGSWREGSYSCKVCYRNSEDSADFPYIDRGFRVVRYHNKMDWHE